MAGNERAPGHTDWAATPTIMVVASDLKLLKLLDMALSLELACEVLTLDNGRGAETAAQRIKPDLLILDEHLLDRKARDLGTQLHSVAGLERVPTLLINAAVPSRDVSQGYPTLFLSPAWKMEELYAAVHELLGHPS
jgi:response regulator RpfG family c-di-GMP phosphodiesterase